MNHPKPEPSASSRKSEPQGPTPAALTRTRRGPWLLAGIATAVCLLADGRFPVTAGAPPTRRVTSVDRLRLASLASVRADRDHLARIRHDLPLLAGLRDLRAVFHVHVEDSAHTGGKWPELLQAARDAGVSAVFLSDHFRPPRDYLDSGRGMREGVLVIPGCEARGFLLYPTASVLDRMNEPVPALLSAVAQGGGLAFLSHIEERPDHPMDGLQGLEIYNRHWDAKREPGTLLALALKLTDTQGVAHLAEALRRFPDEVLGAQVDYPADYLAKWDRETAERRLTGIAANDSHHNQVFVVTLADRNAVLLGTAVDNPAKRQRVPLWLRPGIRGLTRGHQPGDELVRLDFDPYVHSFRDVSTHLLATALTESALRDALRAGHAYVAHDWMADPTGFAFLASAAGRDEPLAIQGDELAWSEHPRLELRARFPVPCSRIRLMRSGRQWVQAEGDSLTCTVSQPGVYRVEGWLLLGGEERCWVLSNPIYIR